MNDANPDKIDRFLANAFICLVWLVTAAAFWWALSRPGDKEPGIPVMLGFTLGGFVVGIGSIIHPDARMGYVLVIITLLTILHLQTEKLEEAERTSFKRPCHPDCIWCETREAEIERENVKRDRNGYDDY